MLTPEFTLAVTTPLAEQPSLPVGLPASWPSLPLREQITFLNSKGSFMRVNSYLSAGLDAGARRLDNLADTHENYAALTRQLGTPAVEAALQAGYTDWVAAMDMPNYEAPRNLKTARSQMFSLAGDIGETFGATYINPRIIYGIFGFKPTGHALSNLLEGKPARPFSSQQFSAMHNARWDLSLRALGGLQRLYQRAGWYIREHIKPLLSDNPPRSVPGGEDRFWESRIAGSGSDRNQTFGAAYYLGYRAKVGPVIKQAMQDRWKDNYGRYREIFITALNINTNWADEDERQELQRTLRNPVYRQINNGNFEGAYAMLAEKAATEPRLFSPPGIKFLLEHRPPAEDSRG